MSVLRAWISKSNRLGWRQSRQIITFSRLFGVALLSQIFLSSNAIAQSDQQPPGHSYVINAPLPSRSITLFQIIDKSSDITVGKTPLAQLSNETEIDKFQSTVDGWAYVRVVETGQEGWINQIVDGIRYTSCCHPLGVESKGFPAPGTFNHAYDAGYEGGNRTLLVKEITGTDFTFTVLEGVEGTNVQCGPKMIKCAKVDGVGKRDGSTYVFRNPAEGDGTIVLQAVDKNTIQLSVTGYFLIDGSMRSLSNTTGTYHRDGGVDVDIDYIGFKVPSGNIICNFWDEDSDLECQMRGHKMSFPNTDCSNPGFDDGYPGIIFSVGPTSKRGKPGCLTDQFYFAQIFNDVPYLGYGETWKRGGYSCFSERAGLKCTNSAGHGFFLSMDGQQVF